MSAVVNEEFVISRVFDAPRELVYQAWSEPERMARWWGPKGFTVQVKQLDLRPGGMYHYCLKNPGGYEMWGKFVYREIVAPERLVFVSSFSDADGNLTRHPMSATWPLETLSTVLFEDEGGKTKLTIQWIPMNATEEERKTFAEGKVGMEQGLGGTLEQLAAYLAETVQG